MAKRRTVRRSQPTSTNPTTAEGAAAQPNLIPVHQHVVWPERFSVTSADGFLLSRYEDAWQMDILHVNLRAMHDRTRLAQQKGEDVHLDLNVVASLRVTTRTLLMLRPSIDEVLANMVPETVNSGE
jgi:hypothetical protein